ncbi:anti-sigma factor [Pseudooctadecabacter jejudonensis]|uniref:Transmembrane transcriptional regulator (Anti-sigma factor) n=1 Tax=Pseudooctadecabacter jejudonensis TaxID=1391910 RepID=A0A1Y5T1F7_9RHOB|nr:hypothetical protein [Pseudooctadecabacter jejudonensis]SLN53967.1 hypothetical protein PSJ8397_02814 [Pseudooctadecabacter jejudonensis]
MTFSDTELKLYLSGALAEDRVPELEDALAVDDALEARLLTLDLEAASDLREAFAHVPLAENVQTLTQLTQSAAKIDAPVRGKLRQWGVPALAAAASFALAVVVTGQSPEPVALDWKDAVAIYQSLYTEDTLANLQVDSAALDQQLSLSAQALGRDLPRDAVGDLDGLPLLRAQILGIDDAPLIQMAYLTEDGQPVAFCMTEGGDAADVVAQTLSGLPTVHWSDGRFSYMIVGDVPADRLSRMADQVRQTL